MSIFRYPRVSTTLLCVHLLAQGCQSRLNALSEDSVSSSSNASSSSYSDTLAAGDVGLAARSRAYSALELHQRSVSPLPALAFGPESWREHFGVAVGNVPSLPPDIDQILDHPCPFWPRKKVRETHLLVLIPSKIDGVPYTLDKLGELIRLRFSDTAARYRYYDADTKNQLGFVSPPASCWVLLTRDVIPDSRCKPYGVQKEQAVHHAARTGLSYRLPSSLEASTTVLAHYVRSGERLFADAPLTYTRCQDLVTYEGAHYPVVVGGFESSGLSIHYDYYSFPCGVSYCREFF